jgi:hypothetical protein
MIDWLSNEELAALKAWASGASDDSDWPIEWPARYVIDNLIVDLEAKTTLLKTALLEEHANLTMICQGVYAY